MSSIERTSIVSNDVMFLGSRGWEIQVHSPLFAKFWSSDPKISNQIFFDLGPKKIGSGFQNFGSKKNWARIQKIRSQIFSARIKGNWSSEPKNSDPKFRSSDPLRYVETHRTEEGIMAVHTLFHLAARRWFLHNSDRSQKWWTRSPPRGPPVEAQMLRPPHRQGRRCCLQPTDPARSTKIEIWVNPYELIHTHVVTAMISSATFAPLSLFSQNHIAESHFDRIFLPGFEGNGSQGMKIIVMRRNDQEHVPG